MKSVASRHINCCLLLGLNGKYNWEEFDGFSDNRISHGQSANNSHHYNWRVLLFENHQKKARRVKSEPKSNRP